MKLEIDVTAQDIADGDKYDLNGCPVTLAVLRALKLDMSEAEFADVHGVSVSAKLLIIYGHGWKPTDLPSVVTDFIHAFDNDIVVQPFKFSVEVGP
jgi:hypothetical protein